MAYSSVYHTNNFSFLIRVYLSPRLLINFVMFLSNVLIYGRCLQSAVVEFYHKLYRKTIATNGHIAFQLSLHCIQVFSENVHSSFLLNTDKSLLLLAITLRKKVIFRIINYCLLLLLIYVPNKCTRIL